MQMCTLKNEICALYLVILTPIGEMCALQFKDVYLKFDHFNI